MRLTESAAPDGPLETVVPSCLHGRVSSPHREETPREGSLDPGLSIGVHRVDWEFDRVSWEDEKGAIDVGDEGVSTTKWCSRRGRARKRRCAPASLLERDPRSRRRGGG